MRTGTRLGRYELLVPIAEGGMARVWVARLASTRGFRKLVAIKTILPEFEDDEELGRMFMDEARIVTLLQHPHVCELYDFGEEQGALYMVMEWVNGDSLHTVLHPTDTAEPISARIAARIVSDAAAGLHAAHELRDERGHHLRVVHRDVSPQNLLISADGYTKVTDFGIAKALDQTHQATQAGQIKGKVAFMSPEQLQVRPVDRRSDVFAAGCVLYYATTGQLPFAGESDAHTFSNIIRGKPTPPSRVMSGYPTDLESIVMRAIAHDPTERFETAEEFHFALEEFVAQSGRHLPRAAVAELLRHRCAGPMNWREQSIQAALDSLAETYLAAERPPPSRTGFVQDRRTSMPPPSRPSRPARSEPPTSELPSLHPGVDTGSATGVETISDLVDSNAETLREPETAERLRNRAIAGIAAGVFVLAAFVGVWWFFLRTPPAPREIERVPGGGSAAREPAAQNDQPATRRPETPPRPVETVVDPSAEPEPTHGSTPPARSVNTGAERPGATTAEPQKSRPPESRSPEPRSPEALPSAPRTERRRPGMSTQSASENFKSTSPKSTMPTTTATAQAAPAPSPRASAAPVKSNEGQ